MSVVWYGLSSISDQVTKSTLSYKTTHVRNQLKHYRVGIEDYVDCSQPLYFLYAKKASAREAYSEQSNRGFPIQ